MCVSGSESYALLFLLCKHSLKYLSSALTRNITVRLTKKSSVSHTICIASYQCHLPRGLNGPGLINFGNPRAEWGLKNQWAGLGLEYWGPVCTDSSVRLVQNKVAHYHFYQ